MKSKTILKAMYVLSLILLVCPKVEAVRVKAPRNTPGTAIFVMADMNSNPTVETKQFNYNNQGLKLNIQVPQIHGLKDLEFEKKLNNKLVLEAKTRKNQIIKEAQSYNEDMVSNGLPTVPFEYIEKYSIIPSQNPYSIIEFDRYQYSGGAHGISNIDYMVINTNIPQIVELKDLFKETANYKAIINENIRKQIDLRTKSGEYFFTGSDGFQTIKDNQPFYINEKGDLIIVFNVYEIAPYAAGTIFFTIPYEEVAPYMK